MNKTIPFPETPHTERYRLADVATYPVDGQHALVYARDTAAMDVLHCVYVDMLMQCREPRLLDEHLAAFCQEKHLGDELIQGLRVKLYQLAQKGYLVTPTRSAADSQQPGAQVFFHHAGKERENIPGVVCTLPNGLSLIRPATSSISGTSFTYEEIFQKETYVKHGITLNEGGCFFDVGANLGLFSLYVHKNVKDAGIYAFEPIPPIFDMLRANIRLYNLQTKLFNYGLADQTQTATFTFYSVMPELSGRFTCGFAGEKCSRDIKDFIDGMLKDWVERNPPDKSQPDWIREITASLEDAFHSETYECPLKTLSQVIRDERVEQIDLLKVDVESSEVDVLTGIKEQDWPKIKQVVLEAHSDELRDESVAILQQHGLKVSTDLCRVLEEKVPCRMVYGTRERADR
jgi:FkbM family methyltransferase